MKFIKAKAKENTLADSINVELSLIIALSGIKMQKSTQNQLSLLHCNTSMYLGDLYKHLFTQGNFQNNGFPKKSKTHSHDTLGQFDVLA